MKSYSQEPVALFCPEPAESRPSTHTVMLSELLLDFLPKITCSVWQALPVRRQDAQSRVSTIV